MKVAIIAIAKNEELYINEWVNYHLNLGFDNIIVCDNDDELILPSVVTDDRVIIEDYTKIYGVQIKAYREMFKKYRADYDWIMFIDIDEFLVLEHHNNVKDFLLTISEEAECVKLCWKHFTDNEELDVIDGNYNVFNRFKTQIITNNDGVVKAFIKTNINDKMADRITQHAFFTSDVYTVNALNEKIRCLDRMRGTPVYEVAWINHYRTKTIGEFIRQKYFRGGPNRNNIKYRNLSYFFETNKKTDEKVAYAEKLIEEIKNNKNKS